MGAAKSTLRGDKLHEQDEPYFEKLSSRNDVTSEWENKKSSGVFGCLSSLTKKKREECEVECAIDRISGVGTPETLSSDLPLGDDTATTNPPPGPLPTNTTLKLPTPKKKNKHTNKRKSHHNTKMNRSSSTRKDSKSKHLLRHARPGDEQSGMPTATYIGSEMSDFHSAKTILVHDDLAFRNSDGFGNHTVEVEGSLQKVSSQINSEVTQPFFQNTLESSFLWDSISFSSVVTVCQFSPGIQKATDRAPKYSENQEAMQTHFFLAVGCDDGTVYLIEIIDDARRQFERNSMNLEFCPLPDQSNQNSKKHKFVHSLRRDARIRSLDFSPDGRFLIVGGDDCTCFVLDINASSVPYFHEINTLSDHSAISCNGIQVVAEVERDDRIYATTWSPSGDIFALGGFDGSLAIYSFLAQTDDSSRPKISLLTELPRPGLILSADWSPDGSLLAVCGSDKRLAIIQANHLERGDFDHLDTEHDENPQDESIQWVVKSEIKRIASVVCIRWSPDGSCLAVGGQDGSVAILVLSPSMDLEERHRVNLDSQDDGRINTLCWSPDGLFLAFGGNDGKCIIVDMKSFVMVHEIKRGSAINYMHWKRKPRHQESGPNKYFLAMGSEDQLVAIVKTGADDDTSTQMSNESSDYDSIDSSSSISSSSKTSGWLIEDSSFHDVDADEYKVPLAVDYPFIITFSEIDQSMKISPYIVISTKSGSIDVRSTEDWRTLKSIQFMRPVTIMKFSKNNEFLAVVVDNLVAIISERTWEVTHEYSSLSSILSLGWNPKSNCLAIGAADGLLILLDCSKWDVIGEMDEKDSPITSLDWSTDGELVAIGWQTTIGIFRAGDLTHNFFVPQLELQTPSSGNQVRSVVLSSESQYLFVATDESVLIYSILDDWALLRQVTWQLPNQFVCLSPQATYIAFGGSESDPTDFLLYKTLESDDYINVGNGYKLENIIAFNAEESLVASLDKEGIVTIYECTTWKPVQKLYMDQPYVS